MVNAAWAPMDAKVGATCRRQFALTALTEYFCQGVGRSFVSEYDWASMSGKVGATCTSGVYRLLGAAA